MTVPCRYFRQAEFNGYLKPLLDCNISFYTSYTFIINTYNAIRRNKLSLVGLNLPTCRNGSGSKVKRGRQQGVNLRKYTECNECANGASNPVS